MKSKEPLLAVLLALVLPGLGQIYSRKMKRGFAFAGIYIGIYTVVSAVFFYAIAPETSLTPPMFFWLVFGLLGFIFVIFVIIDSYRCAKIFNQNHNLKREITLAKRIVLILGSIVIASIHPLSNSGKDVVIYSNPNNIQAYRMPAGSMSPTIQPEDRVLVDKVIYIESKPQRGDLIIFRYPLDPDRDFIKRLIAFGGETVEVKEGNIYVDGKLITDPRIKNIFYYNRGDYGQSGRSVKVPEGHYFVLGDNSALSHDSRFWGFVPKGNIIGKVYKIYWPINRSGSVE